MTENPERPILEPSRVLDLLLHSGLKEHLNNLCQFNETVIHPGPNDVLYLQQ